MAEFELTFDGAMADRGYLEFYDAARALAGFQRSLALTAHLVINGEIITQAPSATGFELFIPPFLEGSWKSRAKLVIGSAIAIGSVGKDSPVGQIVTSVYSYALSETMGFPADYNKTLQQQYKGYLDKKEISETKIDSLCEKIENSVADMHRPIIISKSALRGQVSRSDNDDGMMVGPLMSPITYEYVKQTIHDNDVIDISGYVTSYNVNTYKGRIFSIEEDRPIPFELNESSRGRRNVGIITSSQHYHGQTPFSPSALINLQGTRLVSVTNKTKRFLIGTVK
jgi:hypothetical protein